MDLIKIEKSQLYIIGLMIVAFSFSVLVRMIWVYQFSDVESFKFAGQFMINTNDGYYWAEGARDLLTGVFQAHDLSPIKESASWLTYSLAVLLPFSFEVNEAKMAVNVVPTFAPIAKAKAFKYEMLSAFSAVITIAKVAALD